MNIIAKKTKRVVSIMETSKPSKTFLENQKQLHVELENYTNNKTNYITYFEYMEKSTNALKEKKQS